MSADLLKICKTKKTELLFLALFLRMLRIGVALCLYRPRRRAVRFVHRAQGYPQELVDGNRLEAVISMPSGVFKPYAGVSTAILIFTPEPATAAPDNVWFYDMTADGFRWTISAARWPTMTSPISLPASASWRRKRPPAHGKILLRAQGGDRGQRL